MGVAPKLPQTYRVLWVQLPGDQSKKKMAALVSIQLSALPSKSTRHSYVSRCAYDTVHPLITIEHSKSHPLRRKLSISTTNLLCFCVHQPNRYLRVAWIPSNQAIKERRCYCLTLQPCKFRQCPSQVQTSSISILIFSGSRWKNISFSFPSFISKSIHQIFLFFCESECCVVQYTRRYGTVEKSKRVNW